mmetsp:Transcript_110587/g.191692  ORF Transcript_110587/g.191692 Transcript_110587/m.191692 type:complete len:136 (-) Transcript_110587:3680-4087(-)
MSMFNSGGSGGFPTAHDHNWTSPTFPLNNNKPRMAQANIQHHAASILHRWCPATPEGVQNTLPGRPCQLIFLQSATRENSKKKSSDTEILIMHPATAVDAATNGASKVGGLNCRTSQQHHVTVWSKHASSTQNDT